MTITADRLRELVVYDPETGIFTWRIGRPKASVGTKAGYKDPLGYIFIRIDKVLYRASRLAFLYMTGEWPENEIDHANRVRDDNRWSNLRQATRSQNLVNTKRKNQTGFRGVYLHKKSGLYRADLRRKSLGYFKTPEEAHAAYLAAAKPFYGEFFAG